MFFTDFNPMTEAEISRKIAAKSKADGPECSLLAGWSFKVRLEGEYAPAQLEYTIQEDGRLTVSENGINYNTPIPLLR